MELDPFLFPPAAIDLLRTAVYRPEAARFYDAMSDSFRWSDELLNEVAPICFRQKNWAFRFLLAYRSSVTRGEPKEGYKPVLDQVARECPNWPGLRPERSSPDLKQALAEKWAMFASEFDALKE